MMQQRSTEQRSTVDSGGATENAKHENVAPNYKGGKCETSSDKLQNASLSMSAVLRQSV